MLRTPFLVLPLVVACASTAGEGEGRDGAGPGGGGGGNGGGDGGGGGSDGGASVDPDSLRAHASNELPLIGAAVAVAPLRDEATYREVLTREYNLVTFENALKWGPTEPSPGVFTFEDADAILEAARAAGQAAHGHTLVWHNQLPDWVTDDLGTAGLREALERRISTVVGRYAGRISSWDVVNEAISDTGGLRDTIFSRLLGPDYLAEAFRLARAADPNAILVYNDYGVEGLSPKSNEMYALLQDLLADGVPIDAVGLQFHTTEYELAAGILREEAIRANIQRLGALGLKVRISELDVRTMGFPGLTAAKLEQQRRTYHLLAEICRSEPACEAVVTWGFTDKHSWIDEHYPPDDPLPFDESYARKPAYAGLRAALDGVAPEPILGPWETSCTSLSTRLVCDPLESDTMWGLYQFHQSGSLEPVTTPVYRGDRAYLAETTTTAAGVSASAGMGRAVARGLQSGKLYARVHVYVPSSADVRNINILRVGEPVPPYGGVGINLLQSGALMMSATTADHHVTTTASLARDHWTCLVLEVTIGASGGAAISVDGVERYRESGFDTLPASGYGDVTFGVTWSQAASPGVKVYVDELAVDTAPLPCD